jgi:S-adenosyl-L-methionine hydrolase (adenosine-forming)
VILTVTDFGVGSPYLGHMRSALNQSGADCEVIDLVADLPPYSVPAAAHFLASQVRYFPKGALFLVVIDPGVGSERLPLVLHADGQWFVGPDNGVLDVVAARAQQFQCYRINWNPSTLSATFHGRDLFAPVAARVVSQRLQKGELSRLEWHPEEGAAADLSQLIYIDHYGNGFSGIRASSVADDSTLLCCGERLNNARTYSDLPRGDNFWYENSVGLIEIAANQQNAERMLNFSIGTTVEILE